MKGKWYCLGMLAIVLVFGMMIVGCEDETPVPPPYVSLGIQSCNWNVETPANGEVIIWVIPYKGVRSGNGTGLEAVNISPSDLSWVTKDEFELLFSGDGSRTASITTVVLEPFSETRVNIKLSVTRSVGESANRTANVYLTVPSSFENKYGTVEWSSRKFDF